MSNFCQTKIYKEPYTTFSNRFLKYVRKISKWTESIFFQFIGHYFKIRIDEYILAKMRFFLAKFSVSQIEVHQVVLSILHLDCFLPRSSYDVSFKKCWKWYPVTETIHRKKSRGWNFEEEIYNQIQTWIG